MTDWQASKIVAALEKIAKAIVLAAGVANGQTDRADRAVAKL